MQPGWLLAAIGFALAFGWTAINGAHRRNPKEKQRVISSVAGFNPQTRRRLLRLVGPTRLGDRVNHALVIASACTLLAIVPSIIYGALVEIAWWMAVGWQVCGSLAGALGAEFLLNSFGCAIVPTDESNSQTPPSA